MQRVLIATDGSVGDVFPLLPVVDALAGSGHDVRLAVPRFLGLQLRLLGRPHVVYGAGSQVSALRDARLVTNRFAGWASWRRLFVEHVTPALREDVITAGTVIDQWSPDVVATTTVAVAPRIAALTRGISHLALSLYPQIYRLRAPQSRTFARRFVDEVRELAPSLAHDRATHQVLAWGVGSGGLLLHDPALLDRSLVPDDIEMVGYPYWDAAPSKTRDIEAADDWLDDQSTPVVLVALGAYMRDPRARQAIGDALRGCGVRLLSVNSGTSHRDSQVLSTGYLPLSRVAPRCAAVVHHGGLGTLIGALRSARPSVVLPGAFDQAFNAALAERAGVGLAATAVDLPVVLHRVLDAPAMTRAAALVAKELVPAGLAAERAAAHILAA